MGEFKQNNNKGLTIIIPMSGIGKRFIDEGYNVPKFLIEVDGKPIIEHVINLFDKNKDDYVFICNDIHLNTHVVKYDLVKILKSIVPNCVIVSTSNRNRKGPVDAILRTMDIFLSKINLNKEIIVSYCDYGTVWNYADFVKNVRSNDYDGSVVCYKGFHPHLLGSDNYAFVKTTKNHNNDDEMLVEIKEKESFTGNKLNEFASNGTYYFKNISILLHYFKELIDKDININDEYYVSLVYNLMVSDGLKVSVFEIEKMLQWGTPYDLKIYQDWSNYFNKVKYSKILNANNNNLNVNNNNNLTLILPMAGKGSRFKDEGYEIPKPLLPIKPSNNMMFKEAVSVLPDTNKKIFIKLKDHDNNNDNVKKIITDNYINSNVIEINNVTDGQASTCMIGIENNHIKPNDSILISACDNSIYYDYDKWLKLYNDKTIDVIVFTFRNNQTSKINPNAYCWLDVNENNNIIGQSNKKFIYNDPLKTHAIIGTMFFRKSSYFIDGYKYNMINNIRTNNEFYVDDVLPYCYNTLGLNVKILEVEHYICWGTPSDYKTYHYWEQYFNKID